MSEIPKSIRALTYDQYGGLDVLRLREVQTRAPNAAEVLVRVHAAALNPKDSLVRKGRFRALSGRGFPKYVGVDFAGEAVLVGAKVVGILPGDRVFGALEEVTYRRGTVATHVCVRANELAPMPGSLGFEQAASLPLVALTSLQALRDRAGVRPGDRVCIHGASGGVGTAAIQLARALGATVTTTSSPGNFELCRALGAEETFDYGARSTFDGTRSYRVVFDAFGNLSFNRVRRALGERGVYVSTVPSPRLFFDACRTVVGWPRARFVLVRSRRADLDTVRTLVDEGRLRAVVDRTVPLDDAVEGVRALETKRTRGKIIIALSGVS